MANVFDEYLATKGQPPVAGFRPSGPPVTAPERPKPTNAPVAEPPDYTLRREQGIGLPTLGTLAGLAAATAWARRPGNAGKLLDLWQRPLRGMERWTSAPGQAKRPVDLPHIGIPGLPSELPMLRRNPGSMLVSETERLGANVTKGFHDIVGKEQTPWDKLLKRPTPPPTLGQRVMEQRPEVIKDVEAHQMAGFISRMATGMTPTQAKASAAATAPQWWQDADAYRVITKNGPFGEDWAKRFMGMERTAERWGPYWPREPIRNEAYSLRGKSGMFGSELRTSVGPAERQRVYPTMKAGEAAGVQYDDPRVAWLNREISALRLIETAKFMQRLENRVVFRTKEAAQQAAGLPPTATVYEIEAMPGAPKWFVPYFEEAKFLSDNLKSPDYGKLGFLNSWAQTLSRNPNLVNPLPHVVKNMAYKYTLAGGNPVNLIKDWQEFSRGVSPMVTAFKKVMPFDETGMTSTEIYHRALRGIRNENHPKIVQLADLALRSTIGSAHRFSAKVIFSQADPAMRYSLWKTYVQRGMSAEEAAGNVWVDLIRYGTRSTVVDAWKAIPFNFFVPWRLGTVTSLYKQLTDHPLRAAMFIGGVDLIREIRYRQTGRWTHLPIDYIESPIAQVIQSKDKNDAALSLIAATLATIFAGPGGAYLFTTLIDVAKDMQMRGEWSRLQNMFWGLSQFVDGGKSAIEIANAMGKGDAAGAARAATNLMVTMATAEHSALNYRPRRLMAALPEVGPFLKKSAEVKMAEGMQQAVERRGERKEKFRDRFRELTIEDRVKSLMESR